jgi:hypothetical protein
MSEDDVSDYWSKRWDEYAGFKSAFGEEPTTTDVRGHQWREVEIYNGIMSGKMQQFSHQQCEACLAERRVLIHPGFPDQRGWQAGGFWGMPGMVIVKDCVEMCNGTINKETSK